MVASFLGLSTVVRSVYRIDMRRVLQPGFDADRLRVVVYCRVSSRGQRSDCIVHTFSGRLDGLRRYEKELKGADLTVEGGR